MKGVKDHFDLTGDKGAMCRVTYAEEYDVAGNLSALTIGLQIASSLYGGVTYYMDGGISAGGQSVASFTSFAGSNSAYLPAMNTYVTVGGSPWTSGSIPHNQDGSCAVTISVNIKGYTQSGGGGSGWAISGSKTISLTTIPRASTPTLSAASPYIGDTVTLTTNRKVSYYTHDITYTFGNTSGTVGTGVGESVQWLIPIALAGAIAGVSGELKILTVTKDGSTVVGSTETTVTLKVPDNDTTKPRITKVTLESVNNGLPDQFNGLYVQGWSAVRATVEAGSDYSTVESYSLTVLGKTSTGNPATSPALNVTGEVAVKVTVTDARGFSRSDTRNVLYYPYSNPSVSPPNGKTGVVCARCRSDGTEDPGGIYLKIEAGRKYSAVNGVNRCVLRYRYRANEGGFSPWETLLSVSDEGNSVNSVIGGVVDSIVTTYTVEIGVIDDAGREKSVAFPIGTADAVWHAPEGGKALGIGKYATRDGLDIGWDCHMNGNRLTGIPEPDAGSDAATKAYADAILGTPIESANYPGCYYRIAGTETEWINPPMAVGTEYRTTDRWLGKAVYTMVVDCGTFADNKKVAVDLGGPVQPIRASVQAGNYLLPAYDLGSAASGNVGTYWIVRTTTGFYVWLYGGSSFKGARTYAQVWYTVG